MLKLVGRTNPWSPKVSIVSQRNGVDVEYIFLNKSGSFKRRVLKSSLTSSVSTTALLINVLSVMLEECKEGQVTIINI